MNAKKLIAGIGAVMMLIGFLLLGFAEGGVFNKIIPFSGGTSMMIGGRIYGGGRRVYHPERAYIDLAKPGPTSGLILIGGGGVGLIFAYASKSHKE